MLLSIHNLKKSYVRPDGGRHAVVDLEQFELRADQQLALSGESGSGKTTFLHLIAGILRADSGDISIGGSTMTGLGEAQRDLLRARSLGYIFQTFNLLQGYSCLENVLLGMTFGGAIDRDFAEHLLDRVGLPDRMHHRPCEMSVGQQQRVAVARALANRPKLVLADEPTGNLDTRNAVEALRLIRETSAENGAALLLVSHDQHILGEFGDRLDLAELNRAGGTGK